ncbi:MAG: NAD-dependent epimerase/dehydratase family protein [Patescibacteria group bacterium]|nr:NAD-dependent epimerase/dehydratase family protein [Patescibacteria group bacterium]
MTKKILITGVAGFIGSNLAERLIKEGYRVVGVDNLSAGVLEQVPKEVEFHKIDIRSKDIFPVFNGVDVVFHFAAKNCISECQLYPLETADVNIIGTLNVFDASLKAKVDRVIYAESSAIYEGTEIFPTPETNFTPQTFYAITKASNHLFAKAYQQFFGLKTVGMRYLNVYGPRQDYRRVVAPVMSAFIIKFLMGKRPKIFGNGLKRRDFIHVDDINDFHIMCINNEKVINKVFNLGGGKNYSIMEIYKMIQDILKIKIEPEFLPDVPGEAFESLGDITEARKIGWEPKMPLRDGLIGMIDYIKKEITKGNIKSDTVL